MSDTLEIGQAVGEMRSDIRHIRCEQKSMRRDIQSVRQDLKKSQEATTWNRRLIVLCILYGGTLIGNIASDQITSYLATILDIVKLIR